MTAETGCSNKEIIALVNNIDPVLRRLWDTYNIAVGERMKLSGEELSNDSLRRFMEALAELDTALNAIQQDLRQSVFECITGTTSAPTKQETFH